jgi:hypothetical protein
MIYPIINALITKVLLLTFVGTVLACAVFAVLEQGLAR